MCVQGGRQCILRLMTVLDSVCNGRMALDDVPAAGLKYIG